MARLRILFVFFAEAGLFRNLCVFRDFMCVLVVLLAFFMLFCLLNEHSFVVPRRSTN